MTKRPDEAGGDLRDETPASVRASGRGRRLGGVPAFDYLSSTLPLAGTYRAIMGVFLANSETFGISIPTDVVFAKLESSCVAHEARSPEHLETLLENLERWSNVSRTQDTSLARTIEDLKRKRSLWRITEEGRLAEEAARRIEATLGASGALRSNLLAALGVGIDDLVKLAGKSTLDAADGRTADTLMRTIFAQAKELADSASAFIAQLDDFLGTPEITADSFVLAREVIVDYVGGFLTELRRTAPLIAEALKEVNGAGADLLITAAATSNPPPTLDPTLDPIEVEAARIRERWEGVVAWFIGSASERARERDLADRAADAIGSLLRIMARLNDARRHTISRSRDFVELARWFEKADDDGTAHRIWHAVFGLGSSRHFTQGEDEDQSHAGGSWWTRRPMIVDPHLRSFARSEGRRGPIELEDTSAARARIRARVLARAEERNRALERFLDRGEQRLSRLGTLTDAEFDLVVEALGLATGTHPEPDGSRLAVALDDRYIIKLVPPGAGEPLALFGCPRGELRGLDYRLTLESAQVVSRRSVAHAPARAS
jgi:uncharacterized protein (TIGR02677 family)